MMIGEPIRRPNPTVHVPPWTFFDDRTLDNTSFPFSVSGISVNDDNKNTDELFSAYDTAPHRYVQSNEPDYDSDGSGLDSDLNHNLYSSDQFRMFEFKIRKCTRARSHDWTDCPFSHPGEKARRRDPRKILYSGTACPDFRKGNCKKGDACEYAHGVFECWLHPSRYRTQPCKDGSNCTRRVCFFAHSPDQLRVLSPVSGHVESYDGSPRRLSMESSCGRGLCLSPESPCVSDSLSSSLGSNSISELVASLRLSRLNKVKSMPTSWGFQMGLGSPRLPVTRPVFSSLPTTPTGALALKGIRSFDCFEKGGSGSGEEPVMERVESGRDLRAKMFEKLSRENPLDRAYPAPPSSVAYQNW